jgi:putative Mg2+ transporter-C (MgtC) family protein
LALSGPARRQAPGAARSVSAYAERVIRKGQVGFGEGMFSVVTAGINEPLGQGWTQIAQFGIALFLSSAIGIEREIRQKSAGLRTYTVVGLGAALFTLLSKYGFTDVVHPGTVVLDPSRVTAQIVSGLGFIGAGVIFVQHGSVRGLTTAATIWLTAGIGAASAAGLPVLAVVATCAYFLVAYGIRPLVHRLTRAGGEWTEYRITYADGRGLLRTLVNECTRSGFAIAELKTISSGSSAAGDGIGRLAGSAGPDGPDGPLEPPDGAGPGRRDHSVEVALTLHGRGDLDSLTARLVQVAGILAVRRADSEGD